VIVMSYLDMFTSTRFGRWRARKPSRACKSMVTRNFFCKPCVVAKQSRPKSERKCNRKNSSGEFVHADLCNRFERCSLGGALHFVFFKDDATGYRTVEFLSCKSEIRKTVKNYVRQVEWQTSRKLHRLRSDNGGEYIAKAVKNFV